MVTNKGVCHILKLAVHGMNVFNPLIWETKAGEF